MDVLKNSIKNMDLNKKMSTMYSFLFKIQMKFESMTLVS